MRLSPQELDALINARLDVAEGLPVGAFTGPRAVARLGYGLPSSSPRGSASTWNKPPPKDDQPKRNAPFVGRRRHGRMPTLDDMER